MSTKSMSRLVLAATMAISMTTASAMGAGSDGGGASAGASGGDYKAAVRLVNAGDYNGAITELKKLERSGNPDVFNYLGYSYRKLGKLRAAKGYYQRALRAKPNHLGALEYYGEWHLDSGDIAGAEKLLARLQKACGKCAEYRKLERAIKRKKSS